MAEETASTKVIIVDDHTIFCDSLALLIKKIRKGIEVIGTAQNGIELLKLLDKGLPDVILMDIQMPEMGGREATQIITAKHPLISVIALSTFDNLWAVTDMVRAGAKGYLLKNTSKEELVFAIETVNNGGTYFTPSVSQHLESSDAGKEDVGKKQLLSEREKEVIRLLCQGKTNKEIASALLISKRTVEGHREKINQKINAKHPVEIMQYAIRNGIYIM